MDRKNCLKVTKTPDMSLNFGIEDTTVLETPIRRARINQRVEPATSSKYKEKDEGIRNYFLYIMLVPLYTLFLYLTFKKPDPAISNLVNELNLLKQKHIKLNEYVENSKYVKKRIDYAKIERNTSVHIDNSLIYYHGLIGFKKCNSPFTIFDENVNVGECLAVNVSNFKFTIVFDKEVEIDSIAFFHPITKDVSSAIHEFEVFLSDSNISLGKFNYDANLCGFQEFKIKESKTKSLDIIINSNNGNKKFTCVYKVYLFGE